MTKYEQAIRNLFEKGQLQEYDTINLGCVGYYLKYGTNIVRHNEVPTLTTKCELAVVVEE